MGISEILYGLKYIDYFGVVKCNVAPTLTSEHRRNNVPTMFLAREACVVRVILQDVLALTSLTLFLAAIAVWAQVLGVI
jgi:hypothetical protein